MSAPRMSDSMSGVRPTGVLRVRLPWLDPTLATAHDFTLSSNEFIDLNCRFRDHLTSPLFLRDVIADAHSAIAALDRRRRIRGDTVWALHRSVRLAAAAAALRRTRNAVGPSAESLDEYFHALATGTRWHFTSRSACPVSDGDPRTLAADDSLGWIGKVFERWVLGSELPKRAADARRVIVVVHDEGQLPFAHLLLRPRTQNFFANRIEVEYGGSVDPRLVSLFATRLPGRARATDLGDADAEISPRLTPTGLLRAARFFRRSPRRCLFVRWRPGPMQRLGARVRRQVATLRAHRIVGQIGDTGVTGRPERLDRFDRDVRRLYPASHPVFVAGTDPTSGESTTRLTSIGRLAKVLRSFRGIVIPGRKTDRRAISTASLAEVFPTRYEDAANQLSVEKERTASGPWRRRRRRRRGRRP